MSGHKNSEPQVRTAAQPLLAQRKYESQRKIGGQTYEEARDQAYAAWRATNMQLEIDGLNEGSGSCLAAVGSAPEPSLSPVVFLPPIRTQDGRGSTTTYRED